MIVHKRSPRPQGGWGTATDALSVRPATPGTAAEAALDWQLIVDRVHRYGWAFDERRSDVLRACFTEQAVWEGNTAGDEPVAPIHGRDQIVDWLSGFWDRQPDQRRHLIVSVVVDNQTAEAADVIAALLLTSAQDSTVSIVLTSFYRLSLVKRGRSWLIAHLFEGFDVAF